MREREREKEGGREIKRERKWEGERERKRETEKEGGRDRDVKYVLNCFFIGMTGALPPFSSLVAK